DRGSVDRGSVDRGSVNRGGVSGGESPAGPVGSPGSDPVVHAVGCAGALAPDAIRRFGERGATDVQLIGCAPSECRYGIGNELAAERLAGDRRPHPGAKFARIVTQDWVPTDRFGQAVLTPGDHRSADARRIPAGREALIGAGLIVALSVAGVVLATRAPFRSETAAASIRLVVDHQQGRPLAADPTAGPIGAVSQVEVRLDGTVLSEIRGDGGMRWSEIVDLDHPPSDEPGSDGGSAADQGRHRLTVAAVVGGDRVPLVEDMVALDRGDRVLVDLTDVPAKPGVADGKRIFDSRAGGCSVCHSVKRGDDGVGPSLAGVATAAETRVEGLTAEQYLRQSILLPDQYIVDGWPAGQMLPIYRERLTAEELDAVISYLLTLEEPTTDQEGGS
ncbi:MAG: c-type cytochrome, partial [Acidimicrobiales bacterium]